MRVVVTGSRNWRDVDIIDEALAGLPRGSTILHGCASGADAIARSFALSIGHEVEDYWPDYVAMPFAEANKKRNQAMIDAGAELVLAFPTNNSRGTWDCVSRARNAGLPIRVHRPNGMVEDY